MVGNGQSRSATAPSTWADPTPPIDSRPAWRRALPLLAWLACLGVAVALLFALGDGRLAAPTLTDPGSWGAWAAGRDPLEVVGVVLRLVALALAWYLTGVTSISVLARVLRAARLVRVADALSVGPVKVVVQQALGVSLAAGVVATSVPGAAGVAAPGRGAASVDGGEVAVMAIVEDESVQAQPAGTAHEAGAVDVAGPADVSGAVGDHREVPIPVPAPVPAGDRAPEPSPTASRPPTTVPATTAPAPHVAASPSTVPMATAQPSEPATAPTTSTAPTMSTTSTTSTTSTAPTTSSTSSTWTPQPAAPEAAREIRVRPGDHFWGLSEEAVAEHLGRPGSEEEVLTHWAAMLTANADRLVVADNPDLLLPGQAVVVPDVAGVLS